MILMCWEWEGWEIFPGKGGGVVLMIPFNIYGYYGESLRDPPL